MSAGITSTMTERTRDEHLSQSVIAAVADAEGVDPTELSVPLYEAIDPDALDALFRSDGVAAGQIRFSYHGYQITVYDDGQLDLVAV